MTNKEMNILVQEILDCIRGGFREFRIDGIISEKLLKEDFEDLQFKCMRHGKLVSKIHCERWFEETLLCFSRPGD